MPENTAGEMVDTNLLHHKLKTEEGDEILVPNVTFITKSVSVSSRKWPSRFFWMTAASIVRW
jgi:small-conductance mechanosensitive channel